MGVNSSIVDFYAVINPSATEFDHLAPQQLASRVLLNFIFYF